jgi:tRNA threonylcarbamoyl adenosine modification protein (Sua5/YciO/YrdC/YwlC family)
MRRLDCTDPASRASSVALATGALRRHQLVVLPTDTVYAVACDAFSDEAVALLNEAKRRSAVDTLPVMIGSLRTLDGIVTGLDPAARDLLKGYWPGPLTATCWAQPSLAWDLGGDGSRVAVRMPLHPLALAVLQEVGPLVVVAANRAGGPVPLTCDDAVEQLGDAPSLYLDAGPCRPAPPSTIVDLTAQPPCVRREGAIPTEVLAQTLPALAGVEASDS